MKSYKHLLPIVLSISALLLLAAVASANSVFLPIVSAPVPTPTPIPATPTPQPTQIPTPTTEPTPNDTMQEVRAMWVTRFDWTNGREPAAPSKIDEIVNNAATAGFNAIYFQVRGTADAYYMPGVEPWAARVSGGAMGEWPSPFWDPLAYFIDQAHANGIELHAYINVYPIADCNSEPSNSIFPRPIYQTLRSEYGTSQVLGQTFIDGLQFLKDHDSQCLGGYQRATPGSLLYDDHLTEIVRDLVGRYNIDGLHLDHIRYAGRNTSCDPVSLCRYSGQEENCSNVPACEITDDYKDWQRQQVSGTVRKLFEEATRLKPDLWVSGAVWPIHENKWGWAASQGFHDYYQDSKGWQEGGYIDSISPMIYSNHRGGCPEDDTFWTRAVWETLVRDFQAESSGRFVVPGIGGSYCNFEEIAWRINKAREIGTAGHAIFSYSYLVSRDFWDELAAGPYSQPAVVPDLPWR